MEAIPDIPERITIQLERSEFITRKLIDRVADDTVEEMAGTPTPLEVKDYPNFGGVYTHEVQASDNVQMYKWRAL